MRNNKKIVSSSVALFPLVSKINAKMIVKIKLLKDNITQFKRNLGTDWASLKVGSWANNLA